MTVCSAFLSIFLPLIIMDMYERVFDVSSQIDLLRMMVITFITLNISLLPLIESLCSSNPWEFEFSGFRRNRTDNLGINSPSP